MSVQIDPAEIKIAVVNSSRSRRREIIAQIKAVCPEMEISGFGGRKSLLEALETKKFDIVLSDLGQYEKGRQNRRKMFAEIGRNDEVSAIIIDSSHHRRGMRGQIIQPGNEADLKVIAELDAYSIDDVGRIINGHFKMKPVMEEFRAQRTNSNWAVNAGRH